MPATTFNARFTDELQFRVATPTHRDDAGYDDGAGFGMARTVFITPNRRASSNTSMVTRAGRRRARSIMNATAWLRADLDLRCRAAPGERRLTSQPGVLPVGSFRVSAGA